MIEITPKGKRGSDFFVPFSAHIDKFTFVIIDQTYNIRASKRIGRTSRLQFSIFDSVRFGLLLRSNLARNYVKCGV